MKNYSIDYDKFADLYDADMGSNIGLSDISFYLDYAASHSPVLELGCGTGRIVKQIAGKNIRVAGIDNSKKMLDKARANLENINTKYFDLVFANMTDFAMPSRYKLAICAFSTYSKILKESWQEKFLRCVYSHLEQGGLFIIDMFVQSANFQSTGFVTDYEKRWSQHNNCFISRKKKITKDISPQINKIELEYTLEDKNGNHSSFVLEDYTRYSSKDELEALLKESGFTVNNVFSGFDKKKYMGNDKQMIFEATRSI